MFYKLLYFVHLEKAKGLSRIMYIDQINQISY